MFAKHFYYILPLKSTVLWGKVHNLELTTPLHTGQFITIESNNNGILIIDSIRNTVAMLRAVNHLMFETFRMNIM